MNFIRIIDIALGDKEGRLSRNKLAIIGRILEGCYKEREDNMNEYRDNEGGSNGSGSSRSDEDNPNSGSIPLIGAS